MILGDFDGDISLDCSVRSCSTKLKFLSIFLKNPSSKLTLTNLDSGRYRFEIWEPICVEAYGQSWIIFSCCGVR